MLPGHEYTEDELEARSRARARLWDMNAAELARILTDARYPVTDRQLRDRTGLIGRIMIHDLPVPGGTS